VLNHVTVMGRFVADPELRRTGTGTAVCSFRLAVERDGKADESGARRADFIDVVVWRGTAEFVAKYFNKGRAAVVDGRLQTRTWQDKHGQNRTNTEIAATSVYFADNKRKGDDAFGKDLPEDEYEEISDSDDDLPF